MDINYKKKRRILGEILKAERQSKFSNQEELAQKLGVNQACISKTESGDRKLDVIQLMEYCMALGITLTELSIKIDSRFSAELPEYKIWKKSSQSRKLAFLRKVSELLLVMR